MANGAQSHCPRTVQQEEDLGLSSPAGPAPKAFSTSCYPDSYVHENAPYGPTMSPAHTAQAHYQTHPGVSPSAPPTEAHTQHDAVHVACPNVVDIAQRLGQYYTMLLPIIYTIDNDNPLLAYYCNELVTNMGNMANMCAAIATLSATTMRDVPEHAGVAGPSVLGPLNAFEDILAFNEDPEGPYSDAALPLGSPLQEESADSLEHNIFPAPSTPLVASPQDEEEIPVDGARNLADGLLAFFTCGERVGIRLSSALQGTLSTLDNGEDTSIFQNAEPEFATKVYYRIFWPGYQGFEHAQYAKSKKKGYITRVKIVQHVAKITAKFIEDNQNFMTTDAKWRVGPNGIQLENIELIGLKRHLKAGVVPVFRYRHALVGPQA